MFLTELFPAVDVGAFLLSIRAAILFVVTDCFPELFAPTDPYLVDLILKLFLVFI
jgi:hypothetical protein